MTSRPLRAERPISHGPLHPSIQVTHIPEMGATSLRVVVSVAALEFALPNVIFHSSLLLEGEFGIQFRPAAPQG